ncbi:MBL fold metallo-hydrolase [Enterococcus columbae]|uniref:Metallo-beta-lactamase n=1 Tax=Enterococcus columbae DSM 7374 = ATCC 51263 TaxID=1121865 RepID=S0KZ88_9ENTE|nr:MBL fold metallo-hydrolase [Enterococcus columbae]EOT44601.1 metallo-beta-lactamase [Enterococcus columbae DSM 7374 = ATCC 51263]EOW87503.1 metallo-beta-lactamase [Enterococcus columbae DSM 7374 = ATCC 51263]
MNIKCIPTGVIQENCYLIWDNDTLLIVDPGEDADKIIGEIEKIKLKPQAILLTHTHYDHIGAVDQLRDAFKIPVYVDEKENAWLSDPTLNLSGNHPEMTPIIVRPADELWEYRTYQIGSITFKVVPTPGHSYGSVSFIFDSFVVAGDALFNGSIGRTDLYTGNFEQLINSIVTQLLILPDDFVVYPGHGMRTTILHEKQTNPFLRGI